jgi:class 3 adenylate cyclase
MVAPARVPGIPLLSALIGGPAEFGTIVLVEFQPNSLWFESAVTIVAQALKAGVRADFHTFQHPPGDARRELEAQGIPVRLREADRSLRIIDSYTIQTGLGEPEPSEPYGFAARSLRMADWKAASHQILDDPVERRVVHLDENNSVLSDHNTEEEITDFFRTRAYEGARRNELLFVHSLVAGVHSDRFYRSLETVADIVVDFAAQEEGGRLAQMVRARKVRGRGTDSRWRALSVLPGGEVAIVPPAPGAPADATASPEGTPVRALAAIMFADIVGFTSLSQRDEARAMRLLDGFRAVVRRALAAYRGTEVKTMGDATLAEFPSALDALQAAIAIQGPSGVGGLSDPGAPFEVRIGVHVGDVLHRGGDILGDAVNIASRIEPLAPPGGVCVSGPVFDQTWNKVDRPFVPLGARRLKNVVHPIEVYLLGQPAEEAK